jgi:hypothetical protein
MDERATLSDVDLQRYYDAMQAMFMTPGWAYLMEDIKRMTEVRENIRVVPTNKVDFVKGELLQLDWLAGLEARLRVAHETLLSDEDLERLV